MTQQQAELATLFSFLGHGELGLYAVIERYVNYHGGLNHGHQMLLINQLREAATQLDAPAAAQFGDRDILHEDGRIAPGFLARFARGYLNAFYDDGSSDAFRREILLPASRNEWCWTDLPRPMNARLREPRRPRIDALFGQGHDLFVAPYGYQLFDRSSGRAWPIAASRALPRSIEGHGVVLIDGPVAVIQDRFDDGNFAHFLYDCVPRVIWLTEHFPEFARRCQFVMGGEPGDYHELILRWVCARLGLSAAQFVYPRDYAIWRLVDEVVFFSDQAEHLLHPLQMCHPETLHRVRGLLDRAVLPADTPERLYISRADAPGRKVSNEAELIRALAGRGYVAVRLEEHSVAMQVALLANARRIVAPHGMGLTNLVFNHHNTTLVEIFHPAMGSDAYAFVARALGLDYRFSLGADCPGTFLNLTADVDHVLSLEAATEAVARPLLDI